MFSVDEYIRCVVEDIKSYGFRFNVFRVGMFVRVVVDLYDGVFKVGVVFVDDRFVFVEDGLVV